jgi:Cu(I)/Ag(I) efflux system protein CusF
LLINQRKTILLTAFLILTLSAVSCQKKPTTPVMHEGVGVIEEVDAEAATVQINHEEIKGYMPPMSMPYKVKDKSLLEQVKTGDKVDFTIEDSSAGIFLIGLKKKDSK